MYPDTDSCPIPLDDEYIEAMKKKLPKDVCDRYSQLQKWGIPSDTYCYILRNNLVPMLEKIIADLGIDPGFTGTLFGHNLKHIEGQNSDSSKFYYERVYKLLKFLKEKGINTELAKIMLPLIYENPRIDFDSVLSALGYKKIPEKEIISKVSSIRREAVKLGIIQEKGAQERWIMGQLRAVALGNISMETLNIYLKKHILQEYSRDKDHD
jgi:glutamyl-tRNA(Gln) amidotransferase subunit E